MFLKSACVFLGLVVATAGQFTYRGVPSDEVHANASSLDSGDGNILKVACSFDGSGSKFAKLNRLRIFAKNAGGKTKFGLIASVTTRTLCYGLSLSGFDAEGEIDASPRLEVAWAAGSQDGYCKLYRCVATGTDASSQAVSSQGTVMVNRADGQSCSRTSAAAQAGGCCGVADQVQANALEIEQMVEDAELAPGFMEKFRLNVVALDKVKIDLNRLSNQIEHSLNSYASTFKRYFDALV